MTLALRTCISSRLTTELLLLRNPQGSENDWFFSENQSRGSLILFCGRVITTELGAALLCITASVESAVYVVFSIGSTPLLLFTEAPWDYSTELLASSSFTLMWNVGNLLVFNPFQINTLTQEPLARFAIDHLPIGKIFKVVFRVIVESVDILLIGQRPFDMRSLNFESASPIVRILDNGLLRIEDYLYVESWMEATDPHLANPVHRNYRELVLQMRNSAQFIKEKVKAGMAFFKQNILESAEIASNVKKQVIEMDAEVIHFVLTRCVYAYVFGANKAEKLPQFFHIKTQLEIANLRQKHSSIPSPNFADALSIPSYFMDNIVPEESRAIFTELKVAASRSLQDPLFFQCWSKACSSVAND